MRHREPEWMDAPDADPIQLQQSLVFIRRINRLLGYTRATLWHMNRFSQSWKPGERIHLIDFATGSADIPRAIIRWADRRGFDIHITAIDLHHTTIHQAARGAADRRLSFVQADALNPPFPDASFDYALTAMFLHHLSNDQAIAVLRNMNRLSRRGLIAADLLRHRRAYAWITLLTAAANPMVRHDARISVRQAFTESEMLAMREGAGIGFARYFRHFGHRFALAGEKNRSIAG